MGLRVLVGRKQAVVSTNDISGDGVQALAERAVAMARGRARGQVCRPRRPGAAGQELSRTRPGRPRAARCRGAGGAGAARRGRRPRREGREQVGRRVGLGRHRRHGAGHQPRLFRRLSRLAPFDLDAGDRRRGHRRWRPTTISPRRCMPAISTRRRRSARAPARRRWRKLNPRKVSTRKVPVIFDSRVVGLDRRPSGQRHQWRLDRAQDELPEGQDGRAACSRPASTSSTIRCASAACARGRSTPRASPAGAWR